MMINRPLLIIGTLALLATSCQKETGNSIELNSEADLTGLTISCANGNYYERKYSTRQDVSVFAANTDADAVQAIRQGLADVFITDEVALSGDKLKELGMKKAMRGEETFDVAFGIRKGNEELLKSANEFITKAVADGTLDAVISHWVDGSPAVPYPDSQVDPEAAPLRCVICNNLAPVGFLGEDGWDGIDPEILKRYALWAGRPIEFKFQDLGSAIIALQTQQADIIAACLYITEERQKSIDFTVPYYLCHAGYFVRDYSLDGTLGMKERLSMNLVTEKRWKLITDGLLETVRITIFAILLGTFLGAGVCALKRSNRKWVRSAIGLYGVFIQGIPTLVLLLIMFYIVLAGSGLSGSTVAIITFALCFAWTSGCIFDTSISSVPKGQTEAGLSLGFTPLRTFTGIVFPQALKKGLPLFEGECVTLLKSTSIVGYIAIMDLTRASDLIRSRTFDALIPLLIITIAYFVLAWLIRVLLNLLLRKK